MYALLLLACGREPDPLAIELHPGAPTRWSDGDEEAHHATVALGASGALVVAWTRGALTGSPRSRRTGIGADGAPSGPSVALLGGAPAELPDVEAEAAGSFLVAFESPGDGVWLERDGAAARLAPEAIAASDRDAVDLAARPDGGACAVWFTDDGGVGRIRGATVDAGLVPETGGLPETIAETGTGSTAAADVAADPDGGCLVVWNEQNSDAPDALWLYDYGPDGRARGEVRIDEHGPESPPRRATVAVAEDRRRLVVWRRRDHEDWTTSEAWLAVLSPAGEILVPPRLLVAEIADDPVAALVGTDTFWASWTTWRAASGWTVRGGLFSLETGEPVVPAIDLGAAGDPHRPHCAAADGEVAVSWEEPAGAVLAVEGVRIGITGLDGT